MAICVGATLRWSISINWASREHVQKSLELVKQTMEYFTSESDLLSSRLVINKALNQDSIAQNKSNVRIQREGCMLGEVYENTLKIALLAT